MILLPEDITRRRSTDSRSEGSKSPHTSTQWQKVPWNLSGSDLDLDRSKSENNSILSDTSTEPSSHSSHSGQSRPEQGPQMRLNRAFALRRARLEAESGKRGKENRTSTASNTQKTIKKSSKLSSSTSTLRDESSSGTSSKINFRIAPTVSKPFTGRQMVQCSDPLKRKVCIYDYKHSFHYLNVWSHKTYFINKLFYYPFSMQFNNFSLIRHISSFFFNEVI